MARLRKLDRPEGRKIAVVDDDEDLRNSTIALLTREGHEVRSAATPELALEMLREWRPDLVLLDYYLEGGTGAEVVEALRKFDRIMQVILVTGYAADQPGRKLMRDLDIQGYHNKADGAERMLVLADGALKHHAALARVARQQGYLERILNAAPNITRLQPPIELLERALFHLQEIVNGGDGLLVTSNNGILVLGDAEEAVSVRAGTGKYDGAVSLPQLPPDVARLATQALASETPEYLEGRFLVVPLRTRDGDRGCMLLECGAMPPDAAGPCTVFAQQVVQSLENVLLYERATVDQLTGLYNRAHGMQRLGEMLKLASRSDRPTSVALLDVDHFKHVNDTWGHAAGDLVLRRLGATLIDSGRGSDIAVRLGGEELVLILPDTGREGALELAERLRQTIEGLEITFEGSTIPITVSIGVATSETSTRDPDALLADADAALYAAKHGGRNQARSAAAGPSIDPGPQCAP